MLRNIYPILLVLALTSFTGCQCGTWGCRTEPWTTPHSINAGLDSCGSCGAPGCGSCGGIASSRGCADPGCSSCGISGGQASGPLQHLRQLANQSACGGGCGEVYWGEWISDPPDCCDPCDDCGNWTGYRGGCSPRKGIFAWANLLRGHRACGCGTPGCNGMSCGGGSCATGSCSGCSTCGGGHSSFGGERIEYEFGTPMDMQQYVPPGPVPGTSVRNQTRTTTHSVQQANHVQQSTHTAMTDPRPAGSGVRTSK